MKVKQSTAGTWTTDKHVNRRGCPVEWSAYDVRMSGNGPVLFDIQAQVLNAHTVNATASYTKSSSAGSGTARYTYDANGNRTEKWTNGLFAARYFYDHDSQLQGISFNNDGDYTDAGDYEYVYDPFGRRVKAVEDGVTRYLVYDGLDCVAELDANKNLTKYYTRGLGLGGGIGDVIAEWRPSATNWYSYNHRGDVTLLTANGGRVTHRAEYTAFGSLSTINYQLSTRSIGFSSKEYDTKSGLSCYGFRYYDPASGRWMTKDPILWLSGDNDLYVANYNNPLYGYDMYGLITRGLNGPESDCWDQYLNGFLKSKLKDFGDQIAGFGNEAAKDAVKSGIIGFAKATVRNVSKEAAKKAAPYLEIVDKAPDIYKALDQIMSAQSKEDALFLRYCLCLASITYRPPGEEPYCAPPCEKGEKLPY